MLKNKKGITLVALVVTIVVLLILAGVSINLVLGDNGIINKAKDAKEKSAEASKNDVIGMEELVQELENAANGGETEQDTIPYLPSSDFHYDTTTSVDNGLVVVDNDGNEYVWVIVPKSLYNNAVYNLNNTKKPKSSEDYDNIEYCLQQYTSLYRNGTDYSDSWAEDTNNEGWFTSEQYTAAKHNMLKSVYENGGFYVGRYEAGIEENRTNNTDKNAGDKYIKPEVTPVSKADFCPYTCVTRTQAQKLAESVNSGNRTSSLMYGVQWDLMLAFMDNDKTKIKSIDVLLSDSTSIGNYNNNLWNVTNVNAKYSINNGQTFISCQYQKTANAPIILTTGADNIFSVQNIYDTAGNVREWTLENSSDDSYYCAKRGGYYYCSGSEDPAVGRSGHKVTFYDVGIGFRVSIY